MSAQWKPEQHAKFKATMARRRAERIAKLADTVAARPKRRSPNEAEDFARFMAAAWKLYKRGV